MFVRIITDRGQHESTLECKRIRIKPVKLNEGGDGKSIDLELLDDNGPVLTTTYECSDLEIILMNNDGKTIDRKSWLKK